MKTYGNDKTGLQLSDKAQSFYEWTDPLKIIEQDDGTYSIRGFDRRDGLSADQVNSLFEQLYDELYGEE